VKNLKIRLKKEWGYFKHDINALWSCREIDSFVFFATLSLPAWILGFILSAIGWYDYIEYKVSQKDD